MAPPDDPGQQPTMMWDPDSRVCPECGSTFGPDVAFCPRDGSRLEAPPSLGTTPGSDSDPGGSRPADPDTDHGVEPDPDPGATVAFERSPFAPGAATPGDEPVAPAAGPPEPGPAAEPRGTAPPPGQAGSAEPLPPDEEEDPAADHMVGEVLMGKWKVLERLGAGSFGTVYKVEDLKGGWIEAVKVLSVDRLTGAEAENARERFLREARIMKRLGTESRHIVGLSTYEEDLEAGLVYFTMEHVEGRTFADVLEEEGPFDLDRIVELVGQACDALIVAHEDPEQVVHRDLKLENLMLTRGRSGDDVVKILDFGIAKIAERKEETRLTTVGGTLGTPGYAAPEQLRAEPVDGRTDLFAMGVILYSMATGLDPWLGNPASRPTEQIYQLMVASDRGEVRPMSATGAEVSPAFESIVLRLLKRNPDDRFQSARELKDALRRLASGEAADAASLRVLTDEDGVEVQVRSGLRTVEEGKTPLAVHGLAPGTYRVCVVDERYEPAETRVELRAGAMDDVRLVTVPRRTGVGATLRRRWVAVAAVAVLLLAVGAVVALRPWGTTLDLDELEARAAAGEVESVRIGDGRLEGRLDRGALPALAFTTPLGDAAPPAVVEDLRAAGAEVDTSPEVARLVGLAAEAQARTLYFGAEGEDVRSYAERIRSLEPGSPQARSLLMKVAERMAWDAEAALADGAPGRARDLVARCLEVVPGHPRCEAAGRSLPDPGA